jgi:signal transduction histidine kinase
MSAAASSRAFRGLPFQHRILFLVAGLLAAGMGGLFLAMLQWMEVRTEEDIRYRLSRAAEILGRVHQEESLLRARRYESLATEPRFVALAQVMEMKGREETLLEQLEEFDLAKRGWTGFGFVTAQGELLAWKGKGRPRSGPALSDLLSRSPVPELGVEENEVLQLFAVGLHPPSGSERPTGYLLLATPFTSAVLDEYALTAGGALELVQEGRPIAVSRNFPGRGGDLRSVEVPLSRTLSFRFSLAVDQVSAPLREMLRTLALVAIGVVILGSSAAYLIAQHMSRPIDQLARAARRVGEGKLEEAVPELGAPELQSLARDFNEMVASLRRSQEELRQKADEILEVGERERARLAQDLHDGLGQDLAGIALHCQGLVKRLSDASGSQEAERIAGLVRRAIETTRALGRGLYPLGLETSDLEHSLREMAASVRQTFGVPAVVDWDARIHVEDRKVATNSYWIAQEAVTNALKHGKPGTLWIRVFAGEHREAVLTVRDDGTGFSAAPARNGGMGLRIMKSRAELIGADLQVAPHPEGGTCVTCTMTRGVRVDP